ncbi:MAG: GDP-fucose synthetase [Xanthomonadales bacterium]|nr:GDP-fucose synthetase [Xanthomonadales bacterium]|tara:strand:- start:1529 stop:2476 length:948 start_codon:yes stop_codon:yes gene_type:complete
MTEARESKVFVAGAQGMVGSSIVRALEAKRYENILGPSHSELDLKNQAAVDDWFDENRPHQVYLAAAKVGGIYANSTYPAEFIYDNLMIEANVIHAAWKSGVEKLLFLGSCCIYPKFSEQPIKESALLSGALEPTNEWYAVAKIAGIKLCDAYRKEYGFDAISLMPTNLYGPGDNFHPKNSHVLPALIRRFHEAKEQGVTSVTIWGTGTPRREFMHCDDLADASVFLMEQYSEPGLINVGCGEDISIMELARLIADIVGFKGEIFTDPGQPDGVSRRMLDSTKLHKTGWEPSVSLESGIKETYRWFLDNLHRYRE